MIVPHLGHTELTIVVATPGVYMRALVKLKENNVKKKTEQESFYTPLRLALTFARFHALKPAVINVSVSGTSTILVPSTTRSATTDSAGFLERAALWARQFNGEG